MLCREDENGSDVEAYHIGVEVNWKELYAMLQQLQSPRCSEALNNPVHRTQLYKSVWELACHMRPYVLVGSRDSKWW